MTTTNPAGAATVTNERLEELATACGLYGVRKAAAAYAREVIALLSASKPAAPEGWKIVPVDPTREMLNAARYLDGTESVYRTMLAASPAAPSADAHKSPDFETALIASLGQKYCPPTGKPRYDWLSPTSADRADLEADAQDERVAWTSKPTDMQIAVAEYDGDTITPLYL